MRGFGFAGVALGTLLSVTPVFAQQAAQPGTIVTFDDAVSTALGNAPKSQQAIQGNAPGPQISQDAAGDPQARVGRISLIEGTVSFHTPDEDSWSYATLNYPVVGGYSFWAEPGSHGEIEAGAAVLRLDGGTEVNLTQLDDSGAKVEVEQGSLNIHVSEINKGESYEITTPNETVLLLQPGTYRIHPGGGSAPDEIAVLKGSAQVGDAESNLRIGAGETALVKPGSNPDISVQPTQATAFDNWSLARDNYEEPRAVSKYVSPQMTGDQDLDRYGTWQPDPTYGQVWYPTAVAVDWQPYHYGHWVWVSPWGWTWIDDAPWGFAPFHYGRWAYIHSHWGWVPGERVARPVYAPALVAFVGGGGWGVSIGIGVQPVGWFPLGPGEIYCPGYRVSHNYYRNVNRAYVRNAAALNRSFDAHANFANRRFATVVSEKDFAGSRAVNKSALHVPEGRLASAPVNATSAPPAMQHPRFNGSRAPAPPNAPHVDHVNAATSGNAPATAGNRNPLSSAIRSATQNNNQTEHANAPGPSIHHRDAGDYHAPSMHSPAVAPSALPASAPAQSQRPAFTHGNYTQRDFSTNNGSQQQRADQQQNVDRERVEQQRASIIQQRAAAQQQHTGQRAAPRELQVQHPQQSAPLVPSHQGWVRQEQHQEQHAEPARAEPASAPANTGNNGGNGGGGFHGGGGHGH